MCFQQGYGTGSRAKFVLFCFVLIREHITYAVFTLKPKHVSTEHVSSNHVCCCIVHIMCQFQTRFMPDRLMYAV